MGVRRRRACLASKSTGALFFSCTGKRAQGKERVRASWTPSHFAQARRAAHPSAPHPLHSLPSVSGHSAARTVWKAPLCAALDKERTPSSAHPAAHVRYVAPWPSRTPFPNHATSPMCMCTRAHAHTRPPAHTHTTTFTHTHAQAQALTTLR